MTSFGLACPKIYNPLKEVPKNDTIKLHALALEMAGIETTLEEVTKYGVVSGWHFSRQLLSRVMLLGTAFGLGFTVDLRENLSEVLRCCNKEMTQRSQSLISPHELQRTTPSNYMPLLWRGQESRQLEEMSVKSYSMALPFRRVGSSAIVGISNVACCGSEVRGGLILPVYCEKSVRERKAEQDVLRSEQQTLIVGRCNLLVLMHGDCCLRSLIEP